MIWEYMKGEPMRLIDADKLKVYRCDDSASRATFDYIYEDDVEDAPTIDLVRCGECKYMRKYALRSDEPTGIWCHRWSVPRLVTDDDFCSYGERRADE